MLHLCFGVLNAVFKSTVASLSYFVDYLPVLVKKDLPEETENSHNFPHITPGPLFSNH